MNSAVLPPVSPYVNVMPSSPTDTVVDSLAILIVRSMLVVVILANALLPIELIPLPELPRSRVVRLVQPLNA